MLKLISIAAIGVTGTWLLLAPQAQTSQQTHEPTPSSQPASTATRAVSVPVADYTRNYIVQAQVYWPDGRSIGATVKLIRRTIKPATSSIVEERIVLHPFEARKTEKVTYTVRGDTMSFEAEDGAFSGEGLIQGPAGAWTGMTFRSTPASSDSYLKGVERWRDDGLSSELEFFTTGDKMRSRIVETGMVLSDDAYNLLVKQLSEHK